MKMFTRFLLLNLCLLSHGYGIEEHPGEPVLWLKEERSVLVHLLTPDLYFWNERNDMATNSPGGFILNFTLTHDNRNLLVNDEPILHRAYPHIPTPLRAHQTGPTFAAFIYHIQSNYSGAPVMDLDYYVAMPDATSGTSTYNRQYNPRIRLDLLRASIPAYPGYGMPLSSYKQHSIWVDLKDNFEYSPGTRYSDISLRIDNVAIHRRWTHGSRYKSQKDLKTCHLWSWLCADIGNYPYYEYIYRENFDQHGKKGSMRHFLATGWAGLARLIGLRQVMGLLVGCMSIVLSMVVYAVFGAVKSVIGVYRKRIQEVDDWLGDEEIDGSLQPDSYIVDFGDVEKGGAAKAGTVTRLVSENLPLPPYTRMKTENIETEKIETEKIETEKIETEKSLIS